MWRILVFLTGGLGVFLVAFLISVMWLGSLSWKELLFLSVFCIVIFVISYISNRNKERAIEEEWMEFQKKHEPRIYVASSWKNEHLTEVVERLREAGYDVYDFRNPPSGDPGFNWGKVDPDYMKWSTSRFRYMLNHPLAERQFNNDKEAMEACNTCVIVLPCGRSAHTEAGWFAGQGKKVLAYIPERQEPELMYKLFDKVCCSMEELLEALK